MFWSRIAVTLPVPISTAYPNPTKSSAHSLVKAAGEIARVVDPSGGKLLLADQSVTLASVGLTHATEVTLPNSGSQFVTSFDEQLLQVEAVGTTVQEVNTRMRVALGKIRRALAHFEHADTLAPRNRIVLTYSPSEVPPIYFQGGSRIRAVLSVALLGAGLTAVARHLARTVGARRRPADSGPDGSDPDGSDPVGSDPAADGDLVETGR